MADEELDDLVIIEDDDEVFEDLEELSNTQTTPQPQPQANTTKIVILFIAVFLLILAGGGIYFLKQDRSRSDTSDILEENTTKIIENIKKNSKYKIQNNSRIKRLTKKAKKLYKMGKTDEALKIYKQISFFNKSLAEFNLGVTLLKNKKYTKAIKHFKNSYELDELKFESLLNIAICYKLLKDKKNFKSYIKQADKLIVSKYNSPLFHYYYGLLEYYKDFPIESSVLLKNYNKKYFSKNKNIILAKEFTYIKNYDLAIDALSQLDDNYLTKALLYAKNGEYLLASDTFLKAIKNNENTMIARVGLSLVQNRLGFFENLSSNLKTIVAKYEDNATNIFPIKVILKPSLFNPLQAQKEFKNSIFSIDKNRYKLLFYFAPYKLFNPNQSNAIIQKGTKQQYPDDIKEAYSYLNQANTISKINLEIIKGIKLLKKHKVYEANKLFKAMIKRYPNHSILHYNLALTYANISDFQNAQKHFAKSFILDRKNYLALFFQAFSLKLLHKEFDDTRLENIIKYSNKEIQNEYKLLYKIYHDDSALSLEKDVNTPFELIINIIASNLIKDSIAYTTYTKKLISLKPKDLIANIIYTDEISHNKTIKEYAKNVQLNLTSKSIDISPLLNGETIARELYVRILNIAGITRFAKNILENELLLNQNKVALLQSLAYTYIYTKNFEKSYKIYNKLIDELKIDDPHTLFLASVASIGSKHHANAIALLELANLTDKKQYESRYALGLLYQEAKDFKGAAIQYAQIGNNGFSSNYFDFKIR